MGRGPTRRRGTKRRKTKEKEGEEQGHLSGYLTHTEHILTPSLIKLLL
jgi:hypothetical protein